MKSALCLLWLVPKKGRNSHSIEFMQCLILVLAASLPIISSEERITEGSLYHTAEIKYSYYDPKKPQQKTEANIKGAFALNLTKNHVRQSLQGKVVLVTSASLRQPAKTDHLGCTADYRMKVPSVEWIALVQRGDCGFTDKITHATKNNNASTVLVYDNHTEFTVMRHKADNKNAVLISMKDGEKLKELLEKHFVIEMEIVRGDETYLSTSKNEANQSSVVFVAISFCIILVISVAWLMFYYIRKFRYSHAKEKLARRLARAAKKAIAKIPQRTVSAGDKELEGDYDQCAVCIEPYKDGDVIRTLPCRHVFHKSCVDPWLLDHRTCPMCKLDILQAYGMSYNLEILSVYGMQGSQDSVHRDVAGAVAGVPGQGGAQSMVLNDPEVSSSLDGESPDSNPELKVVLVPHSCLHYHHHHHHGCQECGDEEDEDVEAGASASLLFPGVQSLSVCREEDDVSVPQSVANTSATVGSTSSLSSRGGRNHSKNRASLARETSIEMEALIPNTDDTNIASATASQDLNSGSSSANITSASALGSVKDEQRHQLEEHVEKGKSPKEGKAKKVADEGNTERCESAKDPPSSAIIRTAVASVHELGTDAGQSEA